MQNTSFYTDASLEGILCTSVFIMNEDAALLGLRHYTDKSVWTTPGGKCDLGEVVEAGLRRETEEETGITDLQDLRLIGDVPGASGRGDILHVYVASTSQQPENREPHKFSEWRYIPLEEVPENFINPAALELVKEHVAGNGR